MCFSLIVVLSCSSLGFTKQFFQEMPIFGNQASNHQSSDTEFQPQGDAFRSEESIGQESDVTAQNRTARNAGHPCHLRSVRKWDSCRKSDVIVAQCLSNHDACYDVGSLCAPVFGYPKAKFILICNAVQIGCQCKPKKKSG